MMQAFTEAAPGTNPTKAAMTSSASPTTTPASVPDGNAGSPATVTTPFPSPKKHCSPSTPDSTPLHRRFLRAVTMSPATPSHSPMEGQRPSDKARDSPVVVRHTPKKTHQSPMKLEVGQGAFYFSMELPPSKITPKKSGTTSKSGTPQGGDTPTRTRTPSPLKNPSPTKDKAMGTPTRTTRSPLKRDESVKQSPARALFGTPTRTRMHKQETDPQTPARTTLNPRKNHSPVKQSPVRISTVTPKRKHLANRPGSHRPGSPIKRSIDQDDSPVDPLKTSARLARKLLSEPMETQRSPPELVGDLKEERGPTNLVATAATGPAPLTVSTGQALHVKKCPENIGHLMASLISNTTGTHDWESAYSTDMISPVPTPLRRASEKLRLGESPSFLRMSANGTTAMSGVDPATHISETGSLAPLEPALIDPRENQSELIERSSSNPSEEEAPPSSKTTHQTTTFEPRLARPLRAASLGSFGTLDATPEVPAPSHRPLLFPKQRSETTQKEPSQQENHTKWQEMDRGQSNPLRPLPAGQQRRAGTEPSVLLKMHKDMANLEATMRRSAGVIDPSFCGPLNLNELPAMSNDFFVRDQQDIRSPGAAGTPKSLSRANSDNSSLGTAVPNGQKGADPVAPSRMSGTPGIPRWKPNGPTPAQATRNRLVAAKQEGSQRTGTRRTSIPARSRPRSNTTVSASAKSAAVPGTSRKSLAIPAKQAVLPEATNLSSPPSRIPSMTSVKARNSTQSVSQTARKPLASASGHGKAVAALKERLPNVPAPPINTRPVPIRKPRDSSAGPQPYEQKFASAGDIAGRLTKWHDDDRKKAQVDPRTVTAKVPLTPPAKTQVESQPEESTTPDGSPAKIPTPHKAPAPTRTSKVIPPAKDAKSRPLSTKPNVPSTPRSKPSAPAPKTPAATPHNAAAVNNTHLRQPVTVAKTPVNRRIPVLDRNATRTPSKAIVSSLDRAIDRKIAEDARSGLEFTPGGNRLKDLLDAKTKSESVVQILEE